MRQRLRRNFENDAFAAFDFLQRAQNIGVALKRGEHRLFDRERRRAFFRPLEIVLRFERTNLADRGTWRSFFRGGERRRHCDRDRFRWHWRRGWNEHRRRRGRFS